MNKCQRTPPEGWPGGPCDNKASYDVLYRIATESKSRRMMVCHRHLIEVKLAESKGLLKEVDVVDLMYAKSS